LCKIGSFSYPKSGTIEMKRIGPKCRAVVLTQMIIFIAEAIVCAYGGDVDLTARRKILTTA